MIFMGFRFRKSVKIAPGVRLNFGKKSTSVTLGGKGARYTVSSTGRKTSSVSIPGTGISYVNSSTTKKSKSSKPTVKTHDLKPVRTYSPKAYKTFRTIFMIIAIVAFVIGVPTIKFGGWIFLIIGGICLYFGIRYSKMNKQAVTGNNQINQTSCPDSNGENY